MFNKQQIREKRVIGEAQQDGLQLQRRAFFWDILLKTYSPQATHLESPSPLGRTQLNLPQQRTLHLDIPRTRPQHIPIASHLALEQLITYYCKHDQLTYKQGINEIFGVVAVFNNVGLSWEKIWEYGRQIINQYCNSFFRDQEFLSLQCVFTWLNQLLRFHDYELFDYINNQNMLCPELYATPWILTLFANKMSLECVFLFWEAYFIENDKLMIFYIVIATLKVYRDKLFGIDQSLLPQTLTGIVINDISVVKQIFKKQCLYCQFILCRAIEIRQLTPFTYSNYLLSSKVLQYENIKQTQAQLDQQQYIMISPHECLFLVYSGVLGCPNSNCSRKSCYYCQSRYRQIPSEMKHFIQQNQDLQELVNYKVDIQREYQLIDLRRNTNYPNSKSMILFDEDGTYDQDLPIGSYICLVEGGYRKLHPLLIQYKLETHQTKECPYCTKKKDEGLWDVIVKVFQNDRESERDKQLEIEKERNKVKKNQREIEKEREKEQEKQNEREKQRDRQKEKENQILEKQKQKVKEIENEKEQDKQSCTSRINYKTPRLIEHLKDDQQSFTTQSSFSSPQIIIPLNANKIIMPTIPMQQITLPKDSKIMKNYSKRYKELGLFRSHDCVFHKLIDYIKHSPFKVYVGKQLKQNEKQKGRIILLSQEFTLIVNYHQSIYTVLLGLQNIKIWHYIGNDTKQSMIETIIQHEQHQLCDISIKGFFLMAFLKKISSKRQNTSIMSFYFKQPLYQVYYRLTQFSKESLISHPFFQFISNFGLENLHHIRLASLYNESTKIQNQKEEIKLMMLLPPNEVNSCIEAGKNFYKEMLIKLNF